MVWIQKVGLRLSQIPRRVALPLLTLSFSDRVMQPTQWAAWRLNHLVLGRLIGRMLWSKWFHCWIPHSPSERQSSLKGQSRLCCCSCFKISRDTTLAGERKIFTRFPASDLWKPADQRRSDELESLLPTLEAQRWSLFRFEPTVAGWRFKTPTCETAVSSFQIPPL